MKKQALTIASFLMIIVGLLRGAGGLLLLNGADKLELDALVTASAAGINAAAYSLVTVCVLLVLSGLFLTIRRIRAAWVLSWVSVILFFLGGLVNGFLLFGHPLGSGQWINLAVSGIIGACLFVGKERIRN